jgi:hypothetical protein
MKERLHVAGLPRRIPAQCNSATLVACATAVSVALNVAHAPDRLAAQLFAALPPVALLGALELLMSVARTGLPHTNRTPGPTESAVAAGAALDPTAGGRWSPANAQAAPRSPPLR